MKPLAIDLFCGLGGWTEGFLAEGYDVVGFGIERHQYGDQKYPAQLVLQDVLTIHGSQFRNAAVIVASPPCQAYSYRAMPWKRAKALPPPDNTLFEACFRLQREAIAATSQPCPECAHLERYSNVCNLCGCDGAVVRFIPLVVENVKGAQPWVGRARWHYGSFYLWGDVPALIPPAGAIKNNGGSWFNIGSPGQTETNKNPVHEGVKQRGSGPIWFDTGIAALGSGDVRRKAASAQIAKIPLPLSTWIARCFKPNRESAA